MICKQKPLLVAKNCNSLALLTPCEPSVLVAITQQCVVVRRTVALPVAHELLCDGAMGCP